MRGRGLVAALALAAALAGCAEPPKPVSPAEQVVRNRIAVTRNCNELQRLFDSGEQHSWVGTMKAADERMKAVGCHG